MDMEEDDMTQYCSCRLHYAVLALVLLSPYGNSAELPMKSGEAEEALVAHMNQSETSYRALPDLIDKYGFDLVEPLVKRLHDPREQVKFQAYSLLKKTGRSLKDKSKRQYVTTKMCEALDSDPAWAARDMLGFLAIDFNEEAKAHIRKRLATEYESLQSQGHCFSDVILLTGVTDDRSQLKLLRRIHEETLKIKPPEKLGKYAIRHYYALRARARMGVKEDIRECIRLVESITEEYLRVTSLEQLAYVRQPEIVEYIKGYLDSDKVASGEPYGKDVLDYPYALEAARVLDKMLVDFPRRANTETQREWMNEQEVWPIRR